MCLSKHDDVVLSHCSPLSPGSGSIAVSHISKPLAATIQAKYMTHRGERVWKIEDIAHAPDKIHMQAPTTAKETCPFCHTQGPYRRVAFIIRISKMSATTIADHIKSVEKLTTVLLVGIMKLTMLMLLCRSFFMSLSLP